MDSLTLFCTIAAVYIGVVYILFFLGGILFDDDLDYENSKYFVWAWPITILCILIYEIASIKFPESLRTFCCRSAYVLSLPFRPVTLGRLVRERNHLS